MSIPIKQPKLLNYKNLNIEKYEYLLPHKTQNGYYQSICNYRLSKNQSLPFYFETPKLKTTSGIVKIENKYYMDLELQQSGECGLFYSFLSKTDDNNISVCHENSKEWFRQIMPLNIVETYYKTPILNKPNGQLPVFRVRLPSYKGNILTEIFNIRKEKVNDISCIQEGDYLIGIIEFSGLMFMSQNFTPCYELQKIKLFKDNDTRLLTSGYIFSDMNETVELDNENHNSSGNNNGNSNGNGNIIKTDNILEDTFNNITIEKQKEIDDTILNNIINNKTVKTIPTIKTKTLFDVIKETTMKDFIIDDTVFKKNNKLFIKRTARNNEINNERNNEINNEKQEPEPIESIESSIKDIELIEDIKPIEPIEPIVPESIVPEPIETIEPIVPEPIEPIVPESIVPEPKELKIEIQDINNINLDIDYNLESPEYPSSPNNTTNDIDYNIINNNKLLEDQEDQEDQEEDIDDNNTDILNILNNYDNDNNNDDNTNLELELDYMNSSEDEDNISNENESESEEDEENEENEDEKGINFDTLNDLEVIVFDE